MASAAPEMKPMIPINGIHPTTDKKQHNPIDQEAFYSPEHLHERQERQARRDALKHYRDPIANLPLNHCWEIPGR